MAEDRVEEVRGLRLRVPADWTRSELMPDFSRDDAFQTLLVRVAPDAPVGVAVAIHPAFRDGTLEEHATRLCAGEGRQVEVSPAIVASRVGVVCDVTRNSARGPVRTRIFYFENAGTLWRIGTVAPATLWSDVEAALTAVICSAELRGTRKFTRAMNLAEVFLRSLQAAHA